MAQTDEITNAGESSKRRRAVRACVGCRAKKLKCDREVGMSSCSICDSHGERCALPPARKGMRTHLDELEGRLNSVTALLDTIPLDSTMYHELRDALGLPPVPEFSSMAGPSSRSSGREKFLVCNMGKSTWKDSTWIGSPSAPVRGPLSRLAQIKTVNNTISGLLVDGETTVADENPQSVDVVPVFTPPLIEDLAGTMKTLRFCGKSSGMVMVHGFYQLKADLLGPPDPRDLVTHICPHWEPTVMFANHPPYEFPEPNLIADLVELYFLYSNLTHPVLHRPSFERALANNMHLVPSKEGEETFGTIVILVLAIGAKYSDDPRVRLDPATQHSAGWPWFNQAQMIRKSMLSVVSLYGIQFYALGVVFLFGSAACHGCWTLAGIGLRMAQDVGIHRLTGNKPTVESELWRRSFWVLVWADREAGMGVGRPPALHDEEIDQELPIVVDDEYWEDPIHPFQQPEGKPSKLAYFNATLRLSQIQSAAQRSIYSMNESKMLLGFVGPKWEQHIVSDLDSALNRWVDHIPKHLLWETKGKCPGFAAQSASLYVNYYHAQTFIHRPFIPTGNKASSPIGFPSLLICKNAARACCRVFSLPKHKDATTFGLKEQLSMFSSGMVLLLSVWSSRQAGVPIQTDILADLELCISFLKRHETRWQFAVKLSEVLSSLANIGEIPIPQPAYSNKRDRDSDTRRSESDSPSSSFAPSPDSVGSWSSGDEPRKFAGSRRVASSSYRSSMSPGSGSGSGSSYQEPLPVFTNELGWAALAAPTYDFGYSEAQAAQMDAGEDFLAAWSSTPMNFELGEWDAYMTSVNGIIEARK